MLYILFQIKSHTIAPLVPLSTYLVHQSRAPIFPCLSATVRCPLSLSLSRWAQRLAHFVILNCIDHHWYPYILYYSSGTSNLTRVLIKSVLFVRYSQQFSLQSATEKSSFRAFCKSCWLFCIWSLSTFKCIGITIF